MSLQEEIYDALLQHYLRKCDGCGLALDVFSTMCRHCRLENGNVRVIGNSSYEHFEMYDCPIHALSIHWCIHDAPDVKLCQLHKICMQCLKEKLY